MANNERIPPEIMRKVRLIELSTKHLVDDLFGGEYHSVFKGSGMEFDEVREYTAGDDVRSIDWNVTARMGRPFIKRYREEREMTVMLVVDASASGLFGSDQRLKSEVIAEVASVLAFSAIRNQDKVGCLIFTDRTEKYIPPEKGHRHVLRIIRELLYFKPEGSGTDLAGALENINRLLKRKAVVFLVTDFITGSFETPLRLAARRHDLIAINVQDPMESNLPNVGLLKVRDAETGEELWLDTASAGVREQFHREAKVKQRQLSQLLGRHGVDEIKLDVTADTTRPLVRFFKQRLKRMSRGGIALLLAGLVSFMGISAQAQTRSNPGTITPPTGQMVPPGHQQTAPPGQGNPAGQGGQQAPPFTPRAQLDKLPLLTLQELTGLARPRRVNNSGDGIEVESLLARDQQTIGQRNSLTWRVALPHGGELLPVEWDLGFFQPLPRFDAAGNPVEIDLSGSETETPSPAAFVRSDTLSGASGDTLLMVMDFTSFIPDTTIFPSQRFKYKLPGSDLVHDLVTDELGLACISVLAADPDSAALRDWKSPGELRGDWRPLLYKVGLPVLLGLALMAAVLYFWLRRRSGDLEMIPAIPADQEALSALETLAMEDLPSRAAFGEYYFRLSHIVRHYMTRRYALPFSDWTTEEINLALTSPDFGLKLDGNLKDPLLVDLARADLVKFARRQPSRDECMGSMESSRQLINDTRYMDPIDSDGSAETTKPPDTTEVDHTAGSAQPMNTTEVDHPAESTDPIEDDRPRPDRGGEEG
jgi:hypothetical protein